MASVHIVAVSSRNRERGRREDRRRLGAKKPLDAIAQTAFQPSPGPTEARVVFAPPIPPPPVNGSGMKGLP